LATNAARGEEVGVVRVVFDSPGGAGVPGEGVQDTVGLEADELDGVISVGGGEGVAVGREAGGDCGFGGAGEGGVVGVGLDDALFFGPGLEVVLLVGLKGGREGGSQEGW